MNARPSGEKSSSNAVRQWRTIGAALMALTIAGCAARDPYVAGGVTARAGQWRIEQQTDRITGRPVSSAFLSARATTSATQLIARNAVLQLLCFRGAPVVRIEFHERIGSNRNSMLGYRFDDRPGKEAEARFLQNYTTVVIEDPAEVAAFARDLATAQTLYVRVRSLNAPRNSAEFAVAGGDEAVRAAYAGCPVQPPPAPSAPARRTGA